MLTIINDIWKEVQANRGARVNEAQARQWAGSQCATVHAYEIKAMQQGEVKYTAYVVAQDALIACDVTEQWVNPNGKKFYLYEAREL